MRLSGPIRFLTLVLALLVTASLKAQTAAANIQSFQLLSSQSGWLLANNHLFFTTDLGAQWTEITPGANAALSGVTFHADGNGWAVESTASTLAIAHTADNGAHWTSTAIASPFTSAQVFNGKATTVFPDAQHGFILLGLQSGSAFRLGILLRSTDGGLTWSQAPTPPIGGDLTFPDATHGFLTHGPSGDELFRTADAGLTWQRVTLTALSAYAKDASAVASPVFTGASAGSLLRTFVTDSGPAVVRYTTTDAGLTWTASAASTSSVTALAINGKTTAPLAASSSVAGLSRFTSAVGQLSIERTSFATENIGWVHFTGGNCAKGTCTQTSALLATLDGGRTYISLGPIPGINLESTTTFALPTRSGLSPLLTPDVADPDSSSVYNTGGVMGFDACSLPTLAQLTSWYASSPYRVVGVYLGGENYANCTSSASLNASWVSSVLAQGWQIIPIWVGPQGVGACSGGCASMSSTPATAMQQGETEADSVVAEAKALGIYQGSTMMYDMEAYTRGGANTTATQSFLQGWTTELHNEGYLAAVYSSHPEFDDWYPTAVNPDVDLIWFAYFFSTGVACGTECQTVFPTQTSSFDLSTSYWLNNHRARQTSSAFDSSYGGTTLNIDEDWVDAPMVTATPNALTVVVTGTGTVTSTTITNSNNDTTSLNSINCGSACTANFAPTDTVVLTASPGSGATFSAWTGCTSTSGTTCTVAVTAAKTVTATFVSGPTLSVARAGNGGGTVTSSDGKINCGSTCTASYPTPSSVTLTATPISGSTFAGWTGSCSGTGTCTVDMTSSQFVTATFTTPVTLTVNKSGTGSGTVTSADGDINCGSTCSYTYAYFSTVVLTATPASGSVFAGWLGACSGTGTCTVTLTESSTVVATFTGPVALTVAKSGAGTGTVTSGDANINCGAACTFNYPINTSIVLTETPATGSYFTGWSGGGCSGTASTCSVTLTAATTVTAGFALASYTVNPPTALSVAPGSTGITALTVATTGNWSGTFSAFGCTGAPAGVTCTASPSTLTFTPTGPTSSSTNITVTVPSSLAAVHIGERSGIVFAGLLLPAMLLPFAFRRRLQSARLNKLLLLAVLLAGAGFTQLLTGCGGSSTPATNTTPIFNGTININMTAQQQGSSTPQQVSVPLQLTIPQ